MRLEEGRLELPTWELATPNNPNSGWTPATRQVSVVILGVQGDLPVLCKMAGILGPGAHKGCGLCGLRGTTMNRVVRMDGYVLLLWLQPHHQAAA